MMQRAKHIPSPVVRRLTKYLTRVQRLRKEGLEWVSSQDLADALGLTSSTVRQDLSHLDVSGISKKGYAIKTLEAVLRAKLGGDAGCRVVIVGAGNLGCALAMHGEFSEQGFEVCAIFDSDPAVVGRRVGNLNVMGMDELPALARRRGVDLGVLAVPAEAAQEVAEQLAGVGIRGLLNLASAHIRVAEKVAVVDARIIEGLQELSFVVNASRSQNGGQ